MDHGGPFSLSHSFERHLRAKNLSDGTVAGYLVGVRQFRVFLEPRGDELEAATRADLEAFIAELLTSRSAATALLDTGARRGEVAGLRVADLDFDLDVALVLGKGRRERALPFGHTTAVALDRYLHPISSATPSPTNGSRRAAARPISCGWPAGSPAPCSSATVPRPPTPGPARPTPPVSRRRL